MLLLNCGANPLVTHVSSMRPPVKESSNRLHVLFLSDTNSVKEFSNVCSQLSIMRFEPQKPNATK